MSGGLKTALLLALATLAGAVAGWINRGPDAQLTFLAVGQGDCILFRHAGATILIDAGPKTDSFDAGERIVVPKLRAYGVSQVDLVLLSHPDADHAGGFAALRKAFPRLRLAISSEFRDNVQMNEMLRVWRLDPSEVLWLPPEQDVTVGRFRLQIRNPDLAIGASDNEGSSFIRLSDGRSTAVFTGDAGMATEEAMLPALDWDADLLKAGHHGSAGSTSPAFLAEVTPRYTVVSCGRTNTYNHPHPDLLDRVEAAQSAVLRTDHQGDLTFRATDDGFLPH